jgi:hypothetical protein
LYSTIFVHFFNFSIYSSLVILSEGSRTLAEMLYEVSTQSHALHPEHPALVILSEAKDLERWLRCFVALVMTVLFLNILLMP